MSYRSYIMVLLMNKVVHGLMNEVVHGSVHALVRDIVIPLPSGHKTQPKPLLYSHVLTRIVSSLDTPVLTFYCPFIVRLCSCVCVSACPDKVEETCTGAVACQLVDSLYPGKVSTACHKHVIGGSICILRPSVEVVCSVSDKSAISLSTSRYSSVGQSYSSVCSCYYSKETLAR